MSDLTEHQWLTQPGSADTCLNCRVPRWAADRITKLEAELERTRQAWVNGDDPMCDDVCLTACKGPCDPHGTA